MKKAKDRYLINRTRYKDIKRYDHQQMEDFLTEENLLTSVRSSAGVKFPLTAMSAMSCLLCRGRCCSRGCDARCGHHEDATAERRSDLPHAGVRGERVKADLQTDKAGGRKGQ